MKHLLPELSYSLEALAPAMSKETMEYHYGKHLQTYIYNRENETSIFSKRNEQKLHFFAPISLPQKHRLNAN